jgi:tetratricopeptide (TPR) repeat protein
MDIWRSARAKKVRTLGLLLVGLICCGAGQPSVDGLLKQAKFAPPEKAKELADKILAIDPKNGDAYAIRGYCKFFTGDYDGSIKDCTKAISLHPKDPFYARSALNYRYHCYIQQEDWKDAMTDCLATLKIEHTPGVAHDAALLCTKVGDKAGASKYEQLCATYLSEEKTKMMALMRKEKDARDPAKVDKVLGELNAELQKDPSDLQACSLRADCYDTKKEYDKACQDLSRLIAAQPSAWPAYVRRSQVYLHSGNKKKSEEDLQKAKQLGFDPAKMQAMAKRRQERIEQQKHPTSSLRPD